jgi:signal transduction histidine kinase
MERNHTVLKIEKIKSNGGTRSDGAAFSDKDGTRTLPLASAIRNISTALANNAGCDDIAAAVAQCAVSMLPECSALVLEVDSDPSSATVIASVNAPIAKKSDILPLESDSILHLALHEPIRCHWRNSEEIERLFHLQENTAAVSDAIVCKAVARPGSHPIVLSVIVEPAARLQADSALITLSELLQALCTAHDVANSDVRSQFAIRNAKNEWEATVDTLSDLVCLIDAKGNILRANRTAERWRLSSVANVRGMNIHEMLHPDCRITNCALEDATNLQRLQVSNVDSYESIIVDERLERALRIHTQHVAQLADEDDSSQHALAVVVISDVTALHNARKELRSLNESLEKNVRERTDELLRTNQKLTLENQQRRAAETELKISRDELALLSEQLMSAQEDERSRLSRELHDSVGQSLGAIKYTLERLAATRVKMADGEPDKILLRAIAGVTEAIRDTRTIAMRLRPPVLDDMGGIAAIQWLIKSFSKTYPDVEFRLDAAVTNAEIAAQLSTQIYRIAQESLNNAVKHAAPKSVLVTIRQDPTELTLEIADDGIGFNANSNDTGQFRRQGHFGHLGMRERAVNSNGVLTIKSSPGNGTKVMVVWKFKDEYPAQEQTQ